MRHSEIGMSVVLSERIFQISMQCPLDKATLGIAAALPMPYRDLNRSDKHSTVHK